MRNTSEFNTYAVVPPRRDTAFEAWEKKPAPPDTSWWLTADPSTSFTAQCEARLRITREAVVLPEGWIRALMRVQKTRIRG